MLGEVAVVVSNQGPENREAPLSREGTWGYLLQGFPMGSASAGLDGDPGESCQSRDLHHV